jgi:uncharacterized protein (TIRG00374 family)
MGHERGRPSDGPGPVNGLPPDGDPPADEAGVPALAGQGVGGVPENGAGPAAPHRRWFPRTIRHLAELLVTGFVLEYFVLPQIGGTHHAIHVLATVNPFLPIGALVLEALSLLAYFQLTRTLIPKSSDPGMATMARIELSTLAVSHCVPGGNFVGASLGYKLLTRAGVAGPDAGVALATQGLGSAVTLNVIFWLALLVSLPLYGLHGHAPHVLYLAAAGLGLVLMLAIAGLVVLFNQGNERAGALLTTLGAKLPFLHPETLPRLFSQLVARVQELAQDRRQLGKTILFSSANWLLDAGSLFLFVAAFGRWVNPAALLVAYGLANIAGALPITPGGLAIIEGTLSSILVGFGTPRTIAILGVIGWRLVNFWLPIPLGGVTYLSLRVHPPASSQAGLAARRALWRARWRWLAELFERETPEGAIDEGLAVIESGAESASDPHPGAGPATGPGPWHGTVQPTGTGTSPAGDGES